MNITERLLQMQDVEYKAFQCKLMPTVDADRVIGIRTPLLRKASCSFSREDGAQKFMAELPHIYFEENNLHAFLIERIQNFDECIAALDKFLPYVDNWATCDSLRPKCFKDNKNKLIHCIYRWIASEHEYTVRFGIGMLMLHYLEDAFDPAHLLLIADIKREEYYIKMMIAWYFATALAKQYDVAVKYLEGNSLPAWTHNKAIQKAIESYRIDAQQKAYLRTLKRKAGV